MSPCGSSSASGRAPAQCSSCGCLLLLPPPASNQSARTVASILMATPNRRPAVHVRFVAHILAWSLVCCSLIASWPGCKIRCVGIGDSTTPINTCESTGINMSSLHLNAPFGGSTQCRNALLVQAGQRATMEATPVPTKHTHKGPAPVTQPPTSKLLLELAPAPAMPCLSVLDLRADCARIAAICAECRRRTTLPPRAWRTLTARPRGVL